MKIAMVFDGLQTGGIEKVGSTYSKIFCSNKHKVTIFNLVPSETLMKCQFDSRCEYIEFKYPRYLAPERFEQLEKNYALGKFLYPFIYVILIIINYIYKILFRIRFNKKYDVIIAFSGHFNDLSFVARNYIRGRKKVCWLHGALYQYALLSYGYLHLYNKIHNLVVLVSDSQREVISYNKRLKLNISKVYNPVSTHNSVNYNRVKEIKNKYGNFILMVARFTYPHKDHYTVIRAFNLLCNKFHDKRINLVLVGDGPNFNNIKKYIDSLDKKVKSRIFLVGNQKDVTSFYSAAFCLVHASVFGEGLPTVILEAMANNCPVVTTDSKVGPREIIGDNEYGLLCPVQDYKKMANQINRLQSSSELYDLYVKKGRIRIKDFYPESVYHRLKRTLFN